MVDRSKFFINAVSNVPKKEQKEEEKKTVKKPRKKKGADENEKQ